MKKATKILAGGGLALMFGLGTLFGVLVAPMNLTHATTSGSEELSNVEQSTGIKLNPKTDPVIYTTESGIDIKFGAATLSNGDLTGYTYITMGSYGGEPLNWVIIGKSTNGFLSNTINGIAWYLTGLAGSSTAINNWISTCYENATDAGVAIDKSGVMGAPIVGINSFSFSSKEVSNVEIPSGCVLCLSEYCLTSSDFDSRNGQSAMGDYSGNTCTLKNVMVDMCYRNSNGVMASSLGFTTKQMSLIQNISLKTAWKSGLTTTAHYVFPLATAKGKTSGNYYNQNFKIETYLKEEALRRAYSIGTQTYQHYWLRTGSPDYDYMACRIFYSSGSLSDYYAYYSHYVRPAFVLKIA